MKRKRLSRGKSRKSFRKGTRTKSANISQRPMRGGWRF